MVAWTCVLGHFFENRIFGVVLGGVFFASFALFEWKSAVVNGVTFGEIFEKSRFLPFFWGNFWNLHPPNFSGGKNFVLFALFWKNAVFWPLPVAKIIKTTERMQFCKNGSSNPDCYCSVFFWCCPRKIDCTSEFLRPFLRFACQNAISFFQESEKMRFLGVDKSESARFSRLYNAFFRVFQKMMKKIEKLDPPFSKSVFFSGRRVIPTATAGKKMRFFQKKKCKKKSIPLFQRTRHYFWTLFFNSSKFLRFACQNAFFFSTIFWYRCMKDYLRFLYL